MDKLTKARIVFARLICPYNNAKGMFKMDLDGQLLNQYLNSNIDDSNFKCKYCKLVGIHERENK